MTQQDLTEILIVLDRSGSMSGVAGDTVGALNTFIEQQKALPGRANFTLLQFDNEFDYIRNAVPLTEIKPITREEFVPRGVTALYDAICMGIDDMGKKLAATPESERASKVVCVILTDGLENASKRHTNADVLERTLRQAKDYNWQFIYLGANQDAIATGERIGVGMGNSANYAGTGKGTAGALRAASAASAGYRTSGQSLQCSMSNSQNITGDEDFQIDPATGLMVQVKK